jgi:hypothetical protein
MEKKMKKIIKTSMVISCLFFVNFDVNASISNAFSGFLSVVKQIGTSSANAAVNTAANNTLSAINESVGSIDQQIKADQEAKQLMQLTDDEIDKSQKDLISADDEMINAAKEDYALEEHLKKSIDSIKTLETKLAQLETQKATNSEKISVIIKLKDEIYAALNVLTQHKGEISIALSDAHKLDTAAKELLRAIQDKEKVAQETSLLLQESLNITTKKYSECS